MYLDTDILLALLKEKDWLKAYIKPEKLQEPKTSVLGILEAQIVLTREVSRQQAIAALERIKSKGIQILPVTEEIIEKSTALLKTYAKLNIFDAVHAAYCLIHKEVLFSTDGIFKQIRGLQCIDPRNT